MRSVVITGGTGSLGHALTRYFLNLPEPPDRIVIYSRDEWKQSVMADLFRDARLRFFLGDVRDRDRLQVAFRGSDTVIHAAALKRVDAIAYNPSEVLRTNVQGTEHVCHAAINEGVRRVVFVSSDKACQPANIYGTSKLMAEHLAINTNVYGAPRGTLISAVRYGNVVGSRGSVVHIFRQAVAQGRPIPITSPLMSRFWITLPQACDLIMTALRDTVHGGELFIPKLPSAWLTDVAKAVAPDYSTVEVGVRDGGEKYHERLLSDEELRHTIDCEAYYLVTPNPHPWKGAATWEGWPIPLDFTYTSDSNARWLSVEQIRAILETVP